MRCRCDAAHAAAEDETCMSGKDSASRERKIDQLVRPPPSLPTSLFPRLSSGHPCGATLLHPEAHVQHGLKPRSAVLRLAPGRSGAAAAACWAARKCPEWRLFAWIMRHPGWPHGGGIQPVDVTDRYCWPTTGWGRAR